MRCGLRSSLWPPCSRWFFSAWSRRPDLTHPSRLRSTKSSSSAPKAASRSRRVSRLGCSARTRSRRRAWWRPCRLVGRAVFPCARRWEAGSLGRRLLLRRQSPRGTANERQGGQHVHVLHSRRRCNVAPARYIDRAQLVCVSAVRPGSRSRLGPFRKTRRGHFRRLMQGLRRLADARLAYVGKHPLHQRWCQSKAQIVA